MLDIPTILAAEPASPDLPAALEIGRSSQGRALHGFRLGCGELRVSLIAGCHADEPVGPATLDLLVSYLSRLEPEHPLLSAVSWHVVPHTNPDGEALNRGWTETLGDPRHWARQKDPVTVDLETYWRHVVRERPGDDVEFGFPRVDANGKAQDEGLRVENRAVAEFLLGEGRSGKPYHLHGSFHGMGFAAGPWFLIERSWADRTVEMRRQLLDRVAERGYVAHDIDRKGDKGFFRIDRGFTSRPDSRAMVEHFEALGDHRTASLFRPSSMEWVKSLGGDPLTLVSEMPLFLLPTEAYAQGDPIRPPVMADLRRALAHGPAELEEAVEAAGLRPMPFHDQMYFQLCFLDRALDAVQRLHRAATRKPIDRS